jgi:hypothetical protein
MKMRAAMLSGHKTGKGKGKLRQWQESHLSHLSPLFSPVAYALGRAMLMT